MMPLHQISVSVAHYPKATISTPVVYFNGIAAAPLAMQMAQCLLLGGSTVQLCTATFTVKPPASTTVGNANTTIAIQLNMGTVVAVPFQFEYNLAVAPMLVEMSLRSCIVACPLARMLLYVSHLKQHDAIRILIGANDAQAVEVPA